PLTEAPQLSALHCRQSLCGNCNCCNLSRFTRRGSTRNMWRCLAPSTGRGTNSGRTSTSPFGDGVGAKLHSPLDYWDSVSPALGQITVFISARNAPDGSLWLGQQTGVAWATLKKHYPKYLPIRVGTS